MDNVEAEGALHRGVGDLQDTDYGRSVVLAVDAGEYPELRFVLGGMLNGPLFGGRVSL